MASKIQVRRGLRQDLPALSSGEFGLAQDTNEVFIGGNSGNIELAKAKKVKGFINIAEYGVVGDGVTSDQTAIANAVADAKLNGYAIHWGWDNKTYLTTASIPDFHKVKHIGNAIIKRGTDLFYLAPTGTQRNKIYVSTTGASNTFDGLSSGQPVARLQVAFDWLKNYGPLLTGFWEIVMTAGTFANRATLQAGLMSENPIEVNGASVGGYPNVPTTILSEGVGASANGIFISNGSKIKVTNIKFTGFNGTSSSSGLKAANGSELETDNCHFDSCYWGISAEGRSKSVVPNGIFNNCGYLNGGGGTGAGARSLQLVNHSYGIQNAGSNANTCLFQNCYQALLLQESSTGHVDWCTVQDCIYGVVVRVNSRANVDGTLFKRNGVDLRAEANGHVFVSSNVQFGTGADESPNKIVTATGGNITSTNIINGVELQYGTIEKAIAMQYVDQTINSLTAVVVHTTTLKAPLWRNTPTVTSPMKKLYFRISGQLNGTANNKRVNVRLGSAVVAVTYSATETGVFTANGYIYFTGADAQYMIMNSERHLGTSTRKSRAVGANVMTADVNLTIEGQVDNAADSIAIEMVEVGWA